MRAATPAALPLRRRIDFSVLPILAAGVFAMSSASVMIRLCRAPAMTIAAYRLVIASVAFGAAAAIKRRKDEPFVRITRWTLASGLFLSLHFASWIRSLDFTSVASSVLLVQTSPIFVALASPVTLRERPSARQWAGISLALLGTIGIAGLDFNAAGTALVGDVLALVGAIGGAGYWVCGRAARACMSTGTYVRTVYGISAIVLALAAAISRQPLWGFSVRDLVLLILIALVPQGIGHTAFNWALRKLSATAVSVFALGEPVGATLLALLILRETVPAANIVGAVLVLSGLGLVLTGEEPADREPGEGEGVLSQSLET